MSTSIQFIKKIKKMNSTSELKNILYLLMVTFACFMEPGNKFSDTMDGMDRVSFLNYIMLLCFCYSFMRSYIAEKNNNPINTIGGLYAVAKTGNLDLKEIFRYIYIRFLPYAAIIAIIALVKAIMGNNAGLYIFVVAAFIIPAILLFLYYLSYKYIAEHRRNGGIRLFTVPFSFLILVLSLIGTVSIGLFGSLFVTAVADAFFDAAMRGDAILLKCFSVYYLNIFSVLIVIASIIVLTMLAVSKKTALIIVATTCVVFIANVIVGANCYVHTEPDKITVSDFLGKTVYGFSDIETVVVHGKEEIKVDAVMKDGRSVTIIDDMTMTTESFSKKYNELYSFSLDVLTEMDKEEVIISVQDNDNLKKDAEKKGALEAMIAIEEL